MQKETFDPWEWGRHSNSVQAVEIRQPSGTLYCSGLTAIDPNGIPITGTMREQLIRIFNNLEELIATSGYECRDIVRLNLFTTSTAEFFSTCADLYHDWIAKHGVKQATSLLEVKGLFAGLSIELEATAAK